MEYQIVQVSAGEGENDLLLTVHYWYNDFDRGLGRTPDVIEDHLFTDIPARRPIMNEVGQFLGSDGVWLTPWELVDDEWIYKVPAEGTYRMEDLDIDKFVIPPIEGRAQLLAELRPPSGRVDKFKPNEIKPNGRANALARREDVLSLRNRTKRVS